jgi:carboxymethylenebutenolidase
MLVATTSVDVNGSAGVIRCAVVRPQAPGKYPLVLAFPDIFGNSEAHLRLLRRLAAYGYVVVSPEPWARFLPAGTVFDFDGDRQAALDAMEQASVVVADEDRHAVLHALRRDPHVDVDATFAVGFCYGGHLAFRAALDPTVKASACCYPTGVHAGKLGACPADTLQRASEIQGELLLIWGRNDPHIPAAGRAAIHAALDAAGSRFEARLFDAEHAFMRDVGPRFEPEATDRAFDAMVALFRRAR